MMINSGALAMQPRHERGSYGFGKDCKGDKAVGSSKLLLNKFVKRRGGISHFQ